MLINKTVHLTRKEGRWPVSPFFRCFRILNSGGFGWEKNEFGLFFCSCFGAPRGALGGQEMGQDLQEDRGGRISLPQLQNRGWSCLKYIHIRGILSFFPPKKRLETLGALWLWGWVHSNWGSDGSVQLSCGEGEVIWILESCPIRLSEFRNCVQFGGYPNFGVVSNSGVIWIPELCPIPRLSEFQDLPETAQEEWEILPMPFVSFGQN